MQKKKKILIISSIILTAVLLSGVICAGFFWYLPHFWLDKLQNDYLLQHRSFIRVKSVQAGAFNKFVLNDVQLGNSDKPLFTAPRAELLLNSTLRGKFSKLPIKSLVLYDCPVKVETAKRKVYINGTVLEDLIREFTKLPPGADAEPLKLEIHSVLAFGSNKPTAALQLVITRTAGKITVSGKWHALDDKKITGSWQAFVDPELDQFSITLADCLTTVFMQEIMLRSGVSAKATALLNQAIISGSGSFSGSFSNLAIKELNYSGKIENPIFAFYKHKVNNIDPFSIKIQKNAQGLSCEIPELSMNNHSNILLKNITISGRKKIEFSAECNFQQLASECLSRSNSIKIKSDTPVNGKLSGVWDTTADTWQLTKEKSAKQPQTLQLQTAGHTIILQLGKIDFQARGKGSAGTLTQHIKYKELEVYTPANKKTMQSSAGYFTLKTVFGAPDRPDMNTLTTSCSKFYMENAGSIVELPGFSASMEIKPPVDNKFDIFTTISSTGGKIFINRNVLELAPWYGRFRLNADLPNKKYQVKNLDLQSDKITLNYSQKELVLDNVHIAMDLLFKNNAVTSFLMQTHANTVHADGLSVKNAKLKLDFDRSRDPRERFKGIASCTKGTFPLSDKWFIRKAVNAEINFSTAELLKIPHKAVLHADLLDWQKEDFSGIAQNAKCQLQKKSAESIYGTAEFDFMKLDSIAHKFGSSQLGKSTLSANLGLDKNGKLSKFDLSGIFAQTSWLKGDYHAGSENVQCDLKFAENSAEPLQGCIIMNKANILGPHITASTPELQCKFTAVDSNNISGNIEFAPGTISNQSGNIELRKAAFSLPLQISSKHPTGNKVGNFTAQDVFFKQHHEGSFSGTIRHFMHLPSSVTDTLVHQIEINGDFLADKFDKKAIKIHSSWLLPPEKSAAKWQFSMPESKLTQVLVLSDYLDLPLNCTALRGSFTLDGTAEFISDQPAASVIKLNSINSDWLIGEITAEGVTAGSVLNLSNHKYSLMPHDATIGKLHWKNWLLTDNELNLSLNSDGKLQIANWHGSLLGGKYRSTQIPSVETGKLKEGIPISFALENIPLNGFFDLFGIKALKSDALLSGDIQLHTDKSGLWVDNSLLAFKSPAGKILQLQLANPSAIKMRDRQFRDFTLAVLNAMKCYQANIKLATAPGEVSLQLKADGVPAKPVPFVYQGRGKKTPFRPSEPGENGFAGEIELNVNLKLHPDKPGA